MHANLKFLASTTPKIWNGSQNFKSRSRDPLRTPFDLILHFFSLVPQVIDPQAKCEVSNSNLSPDMEGSQNTKK